MKYVTVCVAYTLKCFALLTLSLEGLRYYFDQGWCCNGLMTRVMNFSALYLCLITGEMIMEVVQIITVIFSLFTSLVVLKID